MALASTAPATLDLNANLHVAGLTNRLRPRAAGVADVIASLAADASAAEIARESITVASIARSLSSIALAVDLCAANARWTPLCAATLTGEISTSADLAGQLVLDDGYVYDTFVWG